MVPPQGTRYLILGVIDTGLYPWMWTWKGILRLDQERRKGKKVRRNPDTGDARIQTKTDS